MSHKSGASIASSTLVHANRLFTRYAPRRRQGPRGGWHSGNANGSKFLIGDLIKALVSFLLIAAAVYFFVVLPVNAVMSRLRRGEAPPDPTAKNCPECLSTIPIAAKRCAFRAIPITGMAGGK